MPDGSIVIRLEGKRHPEVLRDHVSGCARLDSLDLPLVQNGGEY